MEGFVSGSRSGSVQIFKDPDPDSRCPKTYGSGSGTLLSKSDLSFFSSFYWAYEKGGIFVKFGGTPISTSFYCTYICTVTGLVSKSVSVRRVPTYVVVESPNNDCFGNLNAVGFIPLFSKPHGLSFHCISHHVAIYTLKGDLRMASQATKEGTRIYVFVGPSDMLIRYTYAFVIQCHVMAVPCHEFDI